MLARLVPLLFVFLSFHVCESLAEPRLQNWITEESGAYARIYETLTDETSRAAVTTWNRGQGVQTLPTYAGVSQVAYSDEFVYVRASGLGFHVMGPWYLDGGPWNTEGSSYGTQLFGNLPSNIARLYRIPRTPVIPGEGEARTLTPAGATGMFADGVSMFDARDTFSYDTSAGQDQTPGTQNIQGDRVWNRFAWVTEGITFDPAQAHQAGNEYHYHASCVGPRFLMGDSVSYDATTNRYVEAFNGRHSPILGWAADGLPVYGPYGFSDPLDAESAVRRMISGYVMRDGAHGTVNLRVTGRTTLPQWVVAMGIDGRTSVQLDPSEYGPDVDASAAGETFVLGQYTEDHAYLGHLTNPEDGELFEQGVDFDLGMYNQRWCVTPEFPEGVWAYFMTIEEDGYPIYPLTTGRQYYGVASGGTVTFITEPVTVAFNGGSLRSLEFKDVSFAESSQAMDLDWRAVEGGAYRVERSVDLVNWETVMTVGELSGGSILTHSASLDVDGPHFYRISLTSVAAFDEAGYDLTGTGGVLDGVSFTFTFNAQGMPPEDAIQTVMVGSAEGAITGYDRAAQRVTVAFDPSTAGNLPLSAVITFTTPNGTLTLTSSNAYTGTD